MSRDEAWALLPWLANGTLYEDEARQVRRHCAECAELRRELAQQQRLAAAIGGEDAVDVELESAWTRLKADLDATQKAPRASVSRRRWRTRPSVRVGLALAASVALFVLVHEPTRLFVTQPFGAPASNEFVTVTTPSDSSVLLRLRAADNADPEVLRALFRDLELDLVDGPTPDGVYTLQVDTRSRAEAAAEILERSANVAVVLVGR